MDFPNEIYDKIVSDVHDEFCPCPSAFSRRTIWRGPQWDDLGGWNPSKLQCELHKLQGVNKRFHAAATKVLLSHASFTFAMTYRQFSRIAKKMAMLTGETNQGVMSRITGMRIDLEFSQMSRYMQMHGYPGADAGGIMIAEKARDNFLRCLAEHQTPLPSVTALEVNLEIAAHVSPLLYRNIATFARNNLPNLSDLYLECSSHILADMGILASLRCPQRKSLRRLTISSRGSPIDLPCQVERLPSLCELGLSNVTVGPITLHADNKGLTTLHLSHLTTSAAYLVSLIMQGSASASASPAGANGFRRQSRLSELVLSYVQLDGFLCDGEVKDPGTWRDVFHIIRKYCPNLKSLRVVFCSYVRRTEIQWGDEVTKRINDADSLQRLVSHVCSRPGAKATGVVMKAHESLVHSF